MSESEFEKWIEKEKKFAEDQIAFKKTALLARDWILDYCTRNARESITDQEYLFIADLKRLLHK